MMVKNFQFIRLAEYYIKKRKTILLLNWEGAAAFFSVTKFKSYITGNDFETILYIDHKPHVGMFKNKESTDGQLANWVLEFSMLKVVI